MFVLTPARDGFEYYSPDTKDKKLSHVSTGHLPAIADIIILFSTSGGITLLIWKDKMSLRDRIYFSISELFFAGGCLAHISKELPVGM